MKGAQAGLIVVIQNRKLTCKDVSLNGRTAFRSRESKSCWTKKKMCCLAWSQKLLGVRRCDSLAFRLALCSNCRHDTMIQLESAPFSSRCFTILGGMYEALQAIRCWYSCRKTAIPLPSCIDAEVWRREDEVGVKGGGSEVCTCSCRLNSWIWAKPKHFSNSSQAGYGLLQWVLAMVKYYEAWAQHSWTLHAAAELSSVIQFILVVSWSVSPGGQRSRSQERISEQASAKEGRGRRESWPNSVFLEKVIRSSTRGLQNCMWVSLQLLALKILRKQTVARQESILAEIRLDWKVPD